VKFSKMAAFFGTCVFLLSFVPSRCKDVESSEDGVFQRMDQEFMKNRKVEATGDSKNPSKAAGRLPLSKKLLSRIDDFLDRNEVSNLDHPNIPSYIDEVKEEYGSGSAEDNLELMRRPNMEMGVDSNAEISDGSNIVEAGHRELRRSLKPTEDIVLDDENKKDHHEGKLESKEIAPFDATPNGEIADALQGEEFYGEIGLEKNEFGEDMQRMIQEKQADPTAEAEADLLRLTEGFHEERREVDTGMIEKSLGVSGDFDWVKQEAEDVGDYRNLNFSSLVSFIEQRNKEHADEVANDGNANLRKQNQEQERKSIANYNSDCDDGDLELDTSDLALRSGKPDKSKVESFDDLKHAQRDYISKQIPKFNQPSECSRPNSQGLPPGNFHRTQNHKNRKSNEVHPAPPKQGKGLQSTMVIGNQEYELKDFRLEAAKRRRQRDPLDPVVMFNAPIVGEEEDERIYAGPRFGKVHLRPRLIDDYKWREDPKNAAALRYGRILGREHYNRLQLRQAVMLNTEPGEMEQHIRAIERWKDVSQFTSSKNTQGNAQVTTPFSSSLSGMVGISSNKEGYVTARRRFPKIPPPSRPPPAPRLRFEDMSSAQLKECDIALQS